MTSPLHDGEWCIFHLLSFVYTLTALLRQHREWEFIFNFKNCGLFLSPALSPIFAVFIQLMLIQVCLFVLLWRRDDQMDGEQTVLVMTCVCVCVMCNTSSTKHNFISKESPLPVSCSSIHNSISSRLLSVVLKEIIWLFQWFYTSEENNTLVRTLITICATFETCFYISSMYLKMYVLLERYPCLTLFTHTNR